MTVYIVAGSTQSYERWLRGPGTAYEREAIHPLGHARQIRIMQRGDTVIVLRDWMQRGDWRRIYNTLIATGRTART